MMSARRWAAGLVAAALAYATGAIDPAWSADAAGHPAEPTVVIIVRHAEKAAAPADDPGLTPRGAERAAALSEALADAGIDAIVTSDLQRSRLTAAPLAARRSIAPRVVPLSSARDVDAHVERIVELLRGDLAGATVLVVGHSHTVPDLIGALGAPAIGELCEQTDYAKMFIVTLHTGSPARLLRASYGPSDPPAPAGCGG